MKLTITQLKAPWPQGAKVGDVVELPSIPGWAVGKCQPVGDDEPVTLEGGQIAGATGKLTVAIDAGAVAELSDQFRTEALAQINGVRAQMQVQIEAITGERDDARTRFNDLFTQHEQVLSDFDGQRQKLTELDAALVAANAKVDELTLALERASAPAQAGDVDTKPAATTGKKK